MCNKFGFRRLFNPDKIAYHHQIIALNKDAKEIKIDLYNYDHTTISPSVVKYLNDNTLKVIFCACETTNSVFVDLFCKPSHNTIKDIITNTDGKLIPLKIKEFDK